LGAGFCRQAVAKRRSDYFYLKVPELWSDVKCLGKDIEWCVIQLESKSSVIYVLMVYRVLSGISEYSIDGLDNILNFLFKPRTEFVICDYINTEYLAESYHKCFDSPLVLFNLISTLNFLKKT